MATDKRSRQRENRAVKQAELSKQKRREKIINTAKRVGIWVIAIFALLILSNLIFS